jgi:hypothetical protein
MSFVAKCVAGTIVDELCELGWGETFGTTSVAPRAAIGTVGDCRDCPDLTHNPEVGGSNPPPATRKNGPQDIVLGAILCNM